MAQFSFILMSMIIGIDEVGRGAWAGPLCIAAVGLGGHAIDGLTDSKKLSKKKRQMFSLDIKQNAPLIGIGWVSATEIDRIGMSEALKLAARRAVHSLDLSDVTQIIVDGTIQLLDDPKATTMKQADLLVPSVSAASVIAKVARDEYMAQLDTVFTHYGFASHVGYGTATHAAALTASGPTPVHRMSFKPLAELTVPISVARSPSDGQRAEHAAALFLIQNGYTVIDTNWKTKWCEIDIIATKGDRTYFVEIKYRRDKVWGDGLGAITSKKLAQMNFAARLWMNSHPHQEVALSCMALSGDEYTVDDHIVTIG